MGGIIVKGQWANKAPERGLRRSFPALVVLAAVLSGGCGVLIPAGTNTDSRSSPTAVGTPSGPASASAVQADGPAPGPVTVTAAPASPSPTAPTPSSPPKVPVIVIDPGHSGRSIRSTTRNELRDIDYPNYPEIYEMFDISVCVAKALRKDGYRVLLTKRHALSSVSHAKRAAVANDNAADLAISVHDDHGVGPRFEATYSQRGIERDGLYHEMYRGEGDHRTVYARPATAKRGQRYARIIATARTQAQGRPVRVAENSFDGRAPLEPGTLALVQLLSKRPWVYNEMGALTAGDPTVAMSITSERTYALGLLTGVEAAVPLVPGQPNPATTSGGGLKGCLTRRVEPTPGKFSRPERYLPYGFG